MKVTVCELSSDQNRLAQAWSDLVDHVRSEGSELVLLPEMPFYPWLSGSPKVDPAQWLESIRAHEEWMGRLSELGAQAVLGTLPEVEDDVRFNQAFVWRDHAHEVEPVHRKRYLPEEAGFWESSWYSRGAGDFKTVDVAGARVGFLICTEMWFFGQARAYGQGGVQLLASPRATLRPSVDKWLAGGRAAAVVSGAYCLSSNLSGPAGEHGEWGGFGWIVEPEEGEVLGTTSSSSPFLTLDLDLGAADAAKTTYPRYVID